MGLYGRGGRGISRPATGFREHRGERCSCNLSFLPFWSGCSLPPSGMRKYYGYHCNGSPLALRCEGVSYGVKKEAKGVMAAGDEREAAVQRLLVWRIL